MNTISTIVRIKLASFICVAPALFSAPALAQKMIPVPAPTGVSNTSTPPLPAPLTRDEQRFRELASYIKSRGSIDAQTRAEIVKLAVDIDKDLTAATTDRDQMLRLLPARAQISIWLDDSAAMDSAFERLLAVTTAPDAVVLAWARELNASGRFEKSAEMLQARVFATDAKNIDAKIAAQAALNSAPALGRTSDQMMAIGTATRRATFGRSLFNRELGALIKDQQKGDLPVVEITTTRGPILVELFEDQAPNTVGNFIEHIEAGTYTGTAFHRFMRGFGVQGGDPTTATGGIGGNSNGGWVIPDESTAADHRAPLVGRLVMAKQHATDSPIKPASNSAGCQFTILTGPAESLDGFYTVFGRVIDAMDRVNQLRAGDQILSVTVISKRNHEYKGVHLGAGSAGEYALPRPGIALTPAQSGEIGQ